MRALFISLFSCALACACAGDRATGPDFSSYPQTPGGIQGTRNCSGLSGVADERAEHVERVMATYEFDYFYPDLPGLLYPAWQTNAAEHVERIMATCEFGYSYPDLPGLGAHLSAYQYEITGAKRCGSVATHPPCRMNYRRRSSQLWLLLLASCLTRMRCHRSSIFSSSVFARERTGSHTVTTGALRRRRWKRSSKSGESCGIETAPYNRNALSYDVG